MHLAAQKNDLTTLRNVMHELYHAKDSPLTLVAPSAATFAPIVEVTALCLALPDSDKGEEIREEMTMNVEYLLEGFNIDEAEADKVRDALGSIEAGTVAQVDELLCAALENTSLAGRVRATRHLRTCESDAAPPP